MPKQLSFYIPINFVWLLFPGKRFLPISPYIGEKGYFYIISGEKELEDEQYRPVAKFYVLQEYLQTCPSTHDNPVIEEICRASL